MTEIEPFTCWIFYGANIYIFIYIILPYILDISRQNRLRHNTQSNKLERKTSVKIETHERQPSYLALTGELWVSSWAIWIKKDAIYRKHTVYHSYHCNNTGKLIPSSCTSMSNLSYTVNTITVDGMALQETEPSGAMILTLFSWEMESKSRRFNGNFRESLFGRKFGFAW